MAELKVVYTHTNKKTNKVIYVGAGTPKRPYDMHSRSAEHRAIIETDGVIVNIVKSGLTIEDASSLELKTILKYGLDNLLNKTTRCSGLESPSKEEVKRIKATKSAKKALDPNYGMSRDATSQHIGVCWYTGTNKWTAQIKIDGKSKYLGVFTDELEAAAWYNKALADHKAGLPVEVQRKKTTSTLPGVSWCKTKKKWRAQIYFDGKVKHLAFFNDELEAAKCYQEALKNLKEGRPPIETKQSSIHKGVHWHKARKKWTSSIRLGGKYKSLGYFDDELEAAEYYKKGVANYKAGLPIDAKGKKNNKKQK